MTSLLAACLIGWFAFNFLSAASRSRGDHSAVVINAFIYGSLAAAVVLIHRH